MRITNIRYILVGILIGIIGWIIESILHTYIFDLGENFIDNLLFLNPHELWMRVIIFSLLIFLGIYSQRVTLKRTKKVVYIERQRLYSLLDELPGFVYLQAYDYTIRYANRYFKEKFGKFKSKKCYELLSNLKQPCTNCPIYSVFLNRIPIEREFKDSQGETYQVYYYPFEDVNKEILVLSLGIDITERKKVDQKLKKEREKIELYLNLIGVIVVAININGDILLLNKKGYEILGYKEGELIGINWFETCLPEKVKGEVLQVFKKIVKGDVEVVEFYENPILTKNGEEKIIAWHNTILYDDNKNIIGCVSSGEDITERTLAVKKLKESEENFRTIAEQSFMGIFIIQDDTVKYANESMSKINEYSIQEMMEWSLPELFNVLHPEDRTIGIERFKLLKKGNNEIQAYFPHKIITKSGKIKYVNVHTKKIQFLNKKAILTVLIDETEKIKAEKIIEEEIKKLKELDQIKNDLINRISHELKTPLTSIFSATNLLLNIYKEELGSKVSSLVETIEEGGNRLKNLIDNLMDVYALESDDLILEVETKNLVEVLQQCIVEVNSMVTKRRHVLTVELPQECYIKIDHKRMSQVITNLLMNAIKYTPPEGEISIQLCECDNWVDIVIKDTGIGFKADEKEKLFTKFGKIERYGQGWDVDSEGPGLGLFISKKIINLHNGEIFLKSESLNNGSIFTIRLYKSIQDHN